MLRLSAFLDNRRLKEVRLSAICTGRLYPQGRSLFLLSVTGWVDPRDTARHEGLIYKKFQSPHRESKPRPSGLWRSAWTNCATTLHRADFQVNILFSRTSPAEGKFKIHLQGNRSRNKYLLLKSSIFWVVTQCVSLVTDVSRQPISPIFKSYAVQEESLFEPFGPWKRDWQVVAKRR